jgi:DNA-binding Xre family transcriptional regulator
MSESKVLVLRPEGTISRALEQTRAEGGPDLDIPALAEQAGVSAEWLYRLDMGRLAQVDLIELESVCRILGRSPNDLLGYEPDL